MAEGADAGAAWENPLIPNARVRQIYLAMTRARVLARVLPGGRRGGGTLGIEACLVSPTVDLGPGDLVSDALSGGVVEFLRGTTLGSVLRPGAATRKRGVTADCGAAGRLPVGSGATERIWAALGAAAVLKTQAAQAKVEAKATGSTARQTGAAVVFALPGEVTPAVWRKALAFAAEQELPMVFVVLPAGRSKGSNSRAPKAGQVGAMALRCGVPGIAVDADDAVAIYRVAQESIGRARSGGGAALMECTPFVVEGAAGKRSQAADAIVGLEGYMLERRIATRTWMEREARAFAKRVAVEKAASR
jgi:hypothetical protein